MNMKKLTPCERGDKDFPPTTLTYLYWVESPSCVGEALFKVEATAEADIVVTTGPEPSLLELLPALSWRLFSSELIFVDEDDDLVVSFSSSCCARIVALQADE